MHTLAGVLLPSADAFESSTAMSDNAMFPETTFNP